MTNIVFSNSARTQSTILVNRDFLVKCLVSDFNAETIEKLRSEVDEKLKKKYKVSLPAVMLSAFPTDDALAEAKEVAKTSKRRPSIKRQMENFQLTGFFQYDVDHLQEAYGITPEEFDKRFFEALKKLEWDAKKRVVMTFRTCSGNGWKAWIKGTPGSSIVEDKHLIDEALGIKADENVLDMCHLCFLPSEKLGDIFYNNLDLYFNDEPVMVDYRVGEEFKYCNQKAASTSSSEDLHVKDSQEKETEFKTLPEFFKGAKWTDIVDAYIQMKWGSRPEEGERNAKLFELAHVMAHIADNRPQWVYQVLADEAKAWGLDKEEIKTTIDSACKKPLETRMSKMLEKAIVIAQQRNAVDKFVAQAPELMEDEKLFPAIRILTSRVMFFQRAAVATMMFTWLGTYVHDLYIKDVDGTVFENALVSFCIGESSVGKNILNILYKIVCEELIKQTKESEEVQLKWNEDTNTADGDGKKKPKRPMIPFAVIEFNATAAFVRWALYNNDKCNHTQAIVHVNEFEQLYQLVNDGGQINICTFIKQLFDRDEFGAKRFTAGASNYTGPTRVNITGAGTLAVFKKMFRQAIIDGTLGRAELPIMEQPEEWDGDFVYKDLGKSLKKELKPYIDKLVAFTPERDEDGDPIPLFIPEAAEISKEMIAYIKEYSAMFEDGKVYRQFAFRTNKMVYNKIYLLYILNDMKWDESFAEFYRWNFHYSMYCKMRLIGQMAKEQLEESQMDNYSRRKLPLASLPSSFTRQQAEKVLKEFGVKKDLADTLSQWKRRGKITTDDGQTFHKTDKSKMLRDI